MSRTFTIGCALVAAMGAYQVSVSANGGGLPSASAGSSASAERSPAEMARDSYNSGIDHRDKARKLEEQAATQVKDRDKNQLKATDEYTKALKDFKKATDLDPSLYQAYNGLAYSYRKTGDYPKALENYDHALSLAPGFPDAMEYRGEAYLGLNRVDDAKSSYMTLFGTDRKQADALLKSMAAWVTTHQSAAAGVDPAVVSALDTWVKERAQIASTTVAMALTGNRSIWQ